MNASACMDTSRYLIPTPAGVLACLGQPLSSEQRRLFEHILLAGRPQPIDIPGFGAALGQPVAAIARIMFGLNRNQNVSVLEEAPSARMDWECTGLSGLINDLVALATPGQKLLVAGADGFSLARVGWSSYEADVMATRQPRDYTPGQGEIWPLYLGSRCFYLSANARIDQKNPVLLKLGYRLLRGCGPFAGEERVLC